ncbi:hypothetical protein GCM10008967_35420 [Bacillus carboniphilus]|uniref:Uncharacterized protein n=1 Tax=Bacillus carboniphilus TaxID=86663 RepID=A0ABP3GFR5_9BACI
MAHETSEEEECLPTKATSANKPFLVKCSFGITYKTVMVKI